MKDVKLFLFKVSALIMLCVALLSGCAPHNILKSINKDICSVVLSESEKYVCADNVKKVNRGENAEFSLTFESGYDFVGTSYGDYEAHINGVDAEGKSNVKLVLRKVMYSTFVTVDVEEEKFYSIKINESEYFRCDESERKVEENGEAKFDVYFKNGFTLGGVEYDGTYTVSGLDGEADENGERRVTLTVANVTASANIFITAVVYSGGEIILTPADNAAVIGYSLNGGKFINQANSGAYYSVSYSLSHHPRPNTSIGTDMIVRGGYTLTGWNTQADGSGEHIGLGSRANVKKGETILLFAEWARWTEAGLFDYTVIDSDKIGELQWTSGDKLTKLEQLAAESNSNVRSAVITKYRGSGRDTLVIPEFLGGLEVAAVAPAAVTDDYAIQTLILPESLIYMMGTAITDCPNIREIYLFDGTRYFEGNALTNTAALKSLHLNANTPPLYGGVENGQLANKIEMLINSNEAPKTILFGSCSLWYGIDTDAFRKATGRAAYNMGLLGGTCALYQLDLIRRYMSDGDTLIHMTEIGSPYQMMYDVEWDSRVFLSVENNYDLIALLDLQRYDNVLAALSGYLYTRAMQSGNGKSGSYDDFLPYMSEYGDMLKEREGDYDNNRQMYLLPDYYDDLYSKDAYRKIKRCVTEFTDKGVDVYYAFGPLNKEGVFDEELSFLNEEILKQFKANSIPVTMVGDMLSSVLPSRYFYDSNYHLSTEGAKVFTDVFIDNFFNNVLYYG